MKSIPWLWSRLIYFYVFALQVESLCLTREKCELILLLVSFNRTLCFIYCSPTCNLSSVSPSLPSLHAPGGRTCEMERRLDAYFEIHTICTLVKHHLWTTQLVSGILWWCESDKWMWPQNMKFKYDNNTSWKLYNLFSKSTSLW